jgi:hypothetical protein
VSWWNRNVKPADEIEDPKKSYAKTYSVPRDNLVGKIIEVNNQKDLEVVTPADPEPNLSTKPKDIVGYCFGYVCPKKHVNSTFENITIDGFKERRVCQKCGEVAKPATVKRIAEAQWGDRSYPEICNPHPKPNWGWYNSYARYLGKTLGWGDPMWTDLKFVHYLDTKEPARRKK